MGQKAATLSLSLSLFFSLSLTSLEIGKTLGLSFKMICKSKQSKGDEEEKNRFNSFQLIFNRHQLIASS